MVDSKKGAKKYFLPLYLTWAIITPAIVSYLSGYVSAEAGQSAFDAIPWVRVPSFFALFGLIWPLTIVISPAFFLSIQINTGLSFFESLSAGNSEVIGIYLLTFFAWLGPLISSIIAIYMHKKEVSKEAKNPDKFGWIDYLAAFV